MRAKALACAFMRRARPGPVNLAPSIRPRIQVAAPLLLPERTISATHRFAQLGREQPRRPIIGNLEEQLAAGGGLEFETFADRDHEGASAADDALRVVDIKIGDVEEARWFF